MAVNRAMVARKNWTAEMLKIDDRKRPSAAPSFPDRSGRVIASVPWSCQQGRARLRQFTGQLAGIGPSAS